MNLLLIDHEDSFTYNLAHLLSGFGNLEVKNFYDIKEKSIKKSDIIIFSPGPGKPSDYPVSLDIYNNYKSKKKIIKKRVRHHLNKFFCNSLTSVK